MIVVDELRSNFVRLKSISSSQDKKPGFTLISQPEGNFGGLTVFSIRE